MSNKHNKPPRVILELNDTETEYLYKLLALSNKQASKKFTEMCGMPSSDSRAVNRASFLIAATADLAMSEHLFDKVKDSCGEEGLKELGLDTIIVGFLNDDNTDGLE